MPAGRRRPEVQELAGDADLLEEQGRSTASTGRRTTIVQRRRGHRLRGLHRRDRLRPGRPAPGRRHLRHGADRRARRVCMKRSPSAWCWPSTPTPPARPRPSGSTSGSSVTRSTWRWPTCPPAWTPATSPARDPRRAAAAVEQATPFLGFRVERVLAGAKLLSPEGRARAAEAALGGDRRAPERARPRPVPDGGRRPLPGRARPAAGRHCAPADPVRLAEPSVSREPPGPRHAGDRGVATRRRSSRRT